MPFCENAQSVPMDPGSAELEAAEMNEVRPGTIVVRLAVVRLVVVRA